MKNITLYLLLVILTCGCTDRQIYNQEINYVNDQFNFSLNIPEEIYYSDNFTTNIEEFDEYTKIEFIYVKIHPDSLFLSTNHLMFTINVYNKDIDSVINGNIIAENDSNIYSFFIPLDPEHIESTVDQELYEKFNGFYFDIEKSFKLI